MTNYAVNDWVSDATALVDAVAALETQLETIDSTKTIRLVGVNQLGSGLFQAFLVTDA